MTGSADIVCESQQLYGKDSSICPDLPSHLFLKYAAAENLSYRPPSSRPSGAGRPDNSTAVRNSPGPAALDLGPRSAQSHSGFFLKNM